MRKVLIILLVVLSFTAATISVYFVLSKEQEHVSDTLYDAIPLDAGLIVDISNYSDLCSLMRESRIWEQLCGISSIKALNDDIQLLDGFAQSHEFGIPFRHHVIFSLHPVGKEEMRSIGFVRMNSEKEAKGLINYLKQQLVGKASFSERSYDQVDIADVVFADADKQKRNFSCAYRQGIFIFSHSSILLENALRQVTVEPNITHQGGLAELTRTAGKSAPANIYINYAQLPRTALTVFHAKHRKMIEPLIRFADWTELDLNLKSDLLLFNGFTICSSSSEQWLAILRPQQAIPVTLTDAMPSTTYAYFWMGIHQIKQYFADYGRYLDQHKESTYKKEISRITNNFGIKLQDDFAEQFENEAALVYANIGQPNAENTSFALFRIKSTSSAVAMIEDWQEAVCKRNSSNVNQNREQLQFDHQLSFVAYKFPFDIPASLFGDIFAGGNNWCAVVDDYLVFGNSSADLKKYLHYTALHASLQTDLNYGKLTNNFSTRCNVMFYCNPALSDNFFEKMLGNDKFKELEGSGGALTRMNALVYQLNTSGDMLYNNIFLKYSSDESALSAPGTQTSWESLLDTAITFKPQLVQNHNTGETEVFVQDMANNTYLLNNVGRILWKVPLPEQIVSPIYQIDLYRNGKLQMLFNTKSYLYVMDRLGNFVEKYPVKLQSPAVGSVALFDYDNNRQYRIMIACENRNVYAYEKTGKPVDGWSFSQSEHPVQTDIYHYRVSNKDYIVFADKYRVYILDRQGKIRVMPEQNFPVGSNTMIALDQSRLVLTDTTGIVHFISLPNGKMEKQDIKTFPSSHFFVFQDIDGDGQGDFIFAGNKRLEVFKKDGKQIIGIDTEEPINMRPLMYEFSATNLKIGIVQPQNNHVWLYNSNGKAHNGFPLKGSTLFSIGRLDKSSNNFNLFVGSSNNFLYNYSVK